MKFGVQVGQEGHTFEQIKRACSECESLGFDSFWVTDHLFTSGLGYPECWTTLSALASVTSRIRLGPLTLCNNFRNPALLAKMATTLDNISGGRLNLGIGTGRLEAEHMAYGYAYPGPRERTERLAESVKILKKMFTEPTATFQGRYYSVKDAPCDPKPVQKPHPPIWIGGGGERLLRVVAELADGWNVVGGVSREDFERKLSVIKRDCGEVGRDPAQIEYSWHCRLVLGRDSAEANRRFARYAASRNLDAVGFRKAMTVVGTPGEASRKLEDYAESASHVMVFFPLFAELDDLKIFAKEVMPSYS